MLHQRLEVKISLCILHGYIAFEHLYICLLTDSLQHQRVLRHAECSFFAQVSPGFNGQIRLT